MHIPSHTGHGLFEADSNASPCCARRPANSVEGEWMPKKFLMLSTTPPKKPENLVAKPSAPASEMPCHNPDEIAPTVAIWLMELVNPFATL